MFSFMWETFSAIAFWFTAFLVFGYLGAWSIGIIAIAFKWIYGVIHGR